MTDYTAQEVDQVLNVDEVVETRYWRSHTLWNELAYGGSQEVELRGEQVTVTRVAGKAPAEGGGERVDVVVQAGDQFFRKTGYYDSEDGAEFDGPCEEVKPKQKTITVYE